MQVLELSLSVASFLPITMTACVASAMDAVDLSSCSVLVHDHNVTGESLAAGSSLAFKAAVDHSCTCARVLSGLCSACTAAAATALMCPSGRHILSLDMRLPGGIRSGTMLGMVLHLGSSLLCAEVTIQFEEISDLRGLTGAAAKASDTLKSMLVSSQV
jgi:hypothetical protein